MYLQCVDGSVLTIEVEGPDPVLLAHYRTTFEPHFSILPVA